MRKDIIFSMEDDFDFQIDDEAFAFMKADFLGQRLDSPLVNIPLDKIRWALSGEKPPSLRFSSTNSLELELVANVKKICGDCEWLPYDPGWMIHTIREIHKAAPSEIIPTLATQDILNDFSGAISRKLKLAIQYELKEFSEYTKQWYSSHVLTRDALDKRRAKSLQANQTPVVRDIGNLKLIIFSRYVFVHCENTIRYMSFDMFLGMCDIFRLRYTAYLMIDVLNKPGLTPELLFRQISWQENIITELGNPGYEIAKAPEGLWKCWVSRLEKGSYEEYDSYMRMISKVYEKLRALDAPTLLLQPLLDLIESVSSSDVAVELFGVIKLISHPVIDVRLSGESSRFQGSTPDTANPTYILRNLNLFLHLILKNYLIKNGCWPTMIFSKDSKKTKLYSLFMKGVNFITDTSYPLADWNEVYIGKIADFDYHEDYLELMKDKSCAPPIHLVKKFYEHRGDKSLRRVMLKLLKTPKIDTTALLYEFAHDLLSDEEYNIFLYPKECEFKLAARMFCMLTFPIRLVLGIIQENVKKNIFKYLPYQSMTMDRNTLTHKLLEMTGGAAENEVLLLEVDLTRWNLKFRHFHMKGYGVAIDHMHGTRNTFGRVHEVFERSVITAFVPDVRIPQMEGEQGDNGIQWTNHKGGFEGIDQATWTIATITMIYAALLGEECTFTLLGQGDNQTLAIKRLNLNETMAVFAHRIMSKIEYNCKMVNHIAKPEEFIDSMTVLTYSKTFIARGRVVPMELKYGLGIAPITSTDLPSVGDSLGAIFSAAIGSAQNAYDPILHWVLALIVSEDTLHRFSKTGGWFGSYVKPMFGMLSKEKVKLMLTVPSVLGGFPISPWSSFIVRSEPDPLGQALSSIRFLCDGNRSYYKVLGYLQNPKSYQRNPDPSLLVADPYSLPFTGVPTQASVLKKQAHEVLKTITRNTDLKEILVATSTTWFNQMNKAIASMRPLFPTIAHDLQKVSLGGKLDEIEQKFTMTRSIIVASRTDAPGRQFYLVHAEVIHVGHILKRIRQMLLSALGGYGSKNTFEISELLRNRWALGKDQIQGVSTSHPLDYSVDVFGMNASGVKVSVLTPYTQTSQRGSQPPYLGAKTRERRSAKEYEITRVPGILDLQKAILIKSTAGGDPGMDQLVSDIISTRTAISVKSLETIFPRVIGGTISHRYEEMSKDSTIAPIGNPTLLTHLIFNTDHVPGISGSKDDYPVAFQQYFSYLAFYVRLIACHHPDHMCRSVVIGLDGTSLPLLIQSTIKATPVRSSPPPLLTNNPLVHIPILHVRDISSIMHLQQGKKASVDALQMTKQGRLNLLVSCFCADVSTRAPSGSRLDSSVLQSGRIVPIDAVTYDLFGSEIIVNAAIYTCQIMTIISYYSVQDRSSSRHRVDGLCEKWASIIMDLFSNHLTRYGANNHFLHQKGLLVSAINRDYLTSTRTLLLRHVVNTTMKALRSPVFCVPNITLYALSKSTIPARGSMYLVHLVLATWKLEVSSLVKSNDDSLRNLIIKVFSLSSVLSGSQRPRDMVSKTVLIALSNQLSQSKNPIALRLYSKLTGCIANGYSYINFGVEEVYRSLRQVMTPPAVPPVSSIQLPIRKGSDGLISITSCVGPSYELILDSIKNQSKPPLTESIRKRFGKLIGIYSVSASEWNNIPWELHDPTMVLGTGAGGVQSLLESLKIPVMGADRLTIIPVDFLGRGGFIPPEVARRGGSSIIDPICESYDLDLTTLEGLSRLRITRYKQVVWDLESRDVRYFLLPFSLLDEVGFTGYIHIKLFLNKKELNLLLGLLMASHGFSNITCALLSKGTLSDEIISELVVSAKMTPGKLSYVSNLIITTAGLRKSYGPFIHDVQAEELMLRQHMCGGLPYSDCPILKDQVTEVTGFLSRVQGLYRGRYSDPAFIGQVVNLALLQILQELEVFPESYQCTRLVSYYDAGRVILINNKVFTVLQQPGFRYMISNILPRILSLRKRLQEMKIIA